MSDFEKQDQAKRYDATRNVRFTVGAKKLLAKKIEEFEQQLILSAQKNVRAHNRSCVEENDIDVAYMSMCAAEIALFFMKRLP